MASNAFVVTVTSRVVPVDQTNPNSDAGNEESFEADLQSKITNALNTATGSATWVIRHIERYGNQRDRVTYLIIADVQN